MVVVTGRLTLKTSYTSSAWLTRMSELSRFVYILCHVTLHVKSNAERVNYSTKSCLIPWPARLVKPWMLQRFYVRFPVVVNHPK